MSRGPFPLSLILACFTPSYNRTIPWTMSTWMSRLIRPAGVPRKRPRRSPGWRARRGRACPAGSPSPVPKMSSGGEHVQRGEAPERNPRRECARDDRRRGRRRERPELANPPPERLQLPAHVRRHDVVGVDRHRAHREAVRQPDEAHHGEEHREYSSPAGNAMKATVENTAAGPGRPLPAQLVRDDARRRNHEERRHSLRR